MIMKKNRIVLAMDAVALTALFASCDEKMCYCYENGRESMVYVNADTPCNSMTRGERGCVESNERMDPGTVALHPSL